MSRRLCWIVAIGWLALVASPAGAITPDERLGDPALEARARVLSRELRCLVCQNESIDESNASLARDVRRLLRERLLAGDDDVAAVGYIVARYGDFVLLRPPVRPATWLLWFGPFVLLAVAGTATVIALRRRAATAAPPPLTAEEHRHLASLMREGDR